MNVGLLLFKMYKMVVKHFYIQYVYAQTLITSSLIC